MQQRIIGGKEAVEISNEKIGIFKESEQQKIAGDRHDCRQEPDGLWMLNPGSCGYGGGTAGLIQVENRKIVSCRILRDEDL